MRTISYDFQGWPVEAMTLWEILKKLGFRKEDGKIVGEISEDLLNAYPRLLEDDGMGYGVNQEYISEIDTGTIYDDPDLHVPVFNVFREEYRQDLIDEMENIPENETN
jgi:hypothetical protein